MGSPVKTAAAAKLTDARIIRIANSILVRVFIRLLHKVKRIVGKETRKYRNIFQFNEIFSYRIKGTKLMELISEIRCKN